VVSLTLILAAAPLCPTGLTPLDEACVVQAKQPGRAVVYFHGMLSTWPKAPELTLLAAEAKKRGVTLVALKGEKGLCQWSKDVTSNWCWPNARSQLPEVGKILERVGRVLVQLPVKGPPVFAGFSNGGYLVTLLASDTKVEASAWVVLHAGGVTGQTFPPGRARPTLLVGAAGDTIQLPGMKTLESTLESWQPKFVLREGVHEVTAADAKTLFDFVESL
jgi:poly(3-hydroxybutyrate) depolymerase